MAMRLLIKTLVEFVEEAVKGTMRYGPPFDQKVAIASTIKVYEYVITRIRSTSRNPFDGTHPISDELQSNLNDPINIELSAPPPPPPPQP